MEANLTSKNCRALMSSLCHVASVSASMATALEDDNSCSSCSTGAVNVRRNPLRLEVMGFSMEQRSKKVPDLLKQEALITHRVLGLQTYSLHRNVERFKKSTPQLLGFLVFP